MKKISYEQAMIAFFSGAEVHTPNHNVENSSTTKWRFIIYKGASEYAYCTDIEDFTPDHFTGPQIEVLPYWCTYEYAGDFDYFISDKDYFNIIEPINSGYETRFFDYKEFSEEFEGGY